MVIVPCNWRGLQGNNGVGRDVHRIVQRISASSMVISYRRIPAPLCLHSQLRITDLTDGPIRIAIQVLLATITDAILLKASGPMAAGSERTKQP
jgi:hypothetical protein